MIKYPVYNLEGKKIREVELSEKIFGLKSNDDLLHQIYVSQYANQRRVIAHTKDRAERAGSGKKPWKQKGTGRARVGSVRTPIWRKGGVVFGPTKDRNFKKDVPKKMNQKALLVALSGKISEKNLVIVESFKLSENKTKLMNKALSGLKLNGSILIGFSKDEKEMKRASRNIEKISNVDAINLNVFDILNNKYLLLSESSVEALTKKYEG
jgi:large subunit ribosomal protein L4